MKYYKFIKTSTIVQHRQHLKLSFVLSIFLKLIVIITFTSCASFQKSNDDSIFIDEKNVTDLNGEYDIIGIKDTLKEKGHNAFDKFHRRFNRFAKDSLKMDGLVNYSFSIKIADKKKVNIKYLRNGKEFKAFSLKYKFESDGFLYLKGKNIKIWGVPYIFGSLETKRIRIRLGLDQNLIVEEVNHYSGAVFIILGIYNDHNYKHRYRRIK